MKDNPIKLAYQAHNYVDRAAYRHGQKKKSDNPAKTAPILAAAMEQFGQAGLPLWKARRKAQQVVGDPRIARYLEKLGWADLKAFLGTIALFLKTYPEDETEVGMVQFQDRGQTQLDPEALGQQALALSNQLLKTHRDNNLNKLKRMADRVRVARNKWEALATLAQFYPLRGVPDSVVNDLVEQLSVLHLRSFQDLMARALLFYEAQSKGWNPNAQRSKSGQANESGS